MPSWIQALELERAAERASAAAHDAAERAGADWEAAALAWARLRDAEVARAPIDEAREAWQARELAARGSRGVAHCLAEAAQRARRRAEEAALRAAVLAEAAAFRARTA